MAALTMPLQRRIQRPLGLSAVMRVYVATAL